MSARNKHRTCAYCRKLRKATVDHVPPKLLLEQPFPPNLLTVPCCGECNQLFKADDEYTRTVIGLDVRASKNTAAQFNLPAIIRSLQRPDARGFAEYIAGQTSISAILGPDGNPMGQMIEADRIRVDATGKHLIRGLYFIETRRPMPGHAILKVGSKAGLRSDHPDMLTIARAWRTVTDHRNGAVGTAFSYAAALGVGVSFWLLLLYDYFFWAGTIDERLPDGPTLIDGD
jgi:hypothetical protein